jgi:hypothetical protein
MKHLLKHSALVFSLCCIVISANCKAQDTIIKMNGDIIYAKITEVGLNAISYKRADLDDGPVYIMNKTEISMLKMRNGQRQDFSKENYVKAMAELDKPDGTKIATPSPPAAPSQAAVPSANSYTQMPSQAAANDKYKIEQIDGRYTLNGQKVSRKEVDRRLAKSKNPAVQLGAKTAKTTKILQKIVGITSIPGTIGGGVTSIIGISQFITAYQTGQLSPAYYMNAGVSLLGTITLPVTSKILKNRRDKLYDKVIDLYNETN